MSCRGRARRLQAAAAARMASRIADGSLASHLGASARRVALAIAAAAPAATAFGLWSGRSRRLDGILTPVVYVLHPIPKAAFLRNMRLIPNFFRYI